MKKLEQLSKDTLDVLYECLLENENLKNFYISDDVKAEIQELREYLCTL